MREPEFDPRACGSCGQRLARLEVGLCWLCRGSPEHIKPIVERVMDEIESPRKDAA